MIYNANIDLVNDNVYIKFGLNSGFLDIRKNLNYASDRERERERERERNRMTDRIMTQFLNTVYYLQLCVGDEFLFPLAKPSRSFQNLTEKSALIILLLSKSRKEGPKNENRLTNKTFTPKNDLDYKFFHRENVSKG